MQAFMAGRDCYRQARLKGKRIKVLKALRLFQKKFGWKKGNQRDGQFRLEGWFLSKPV